MKLTVAGFSAVPAHSLIVFITLSYVLLGNLEPIQAQTRQASRAGSLVLVRDDTTGAVTLLPTSGGEIHPELQPLCY